jgi:hypothetical protein
MAISILNSDTSSAIALIHMKQRKRNRIGSKIATPATKYFVE